MKKILMYSCVFLLVTFKVNGQSTIIDSSIYYVNGEGTFLNLGKGEGTKFNLLTTVQSGLQLNQLDSGVLSTKSNRMSLNLVRIAFSGSALKDKMTFGLVTDFTSTAPILEGWVGISVFKKRGRFYLGQRQTHTNNRLGMADERFSQVMGQTLAGKSNDGIVYGGLMQNFVGSTREGGLFLETNFNVKGWKIYPSVSVTTGEGQNFFSVQPNVGFKYGGRLDVLPMGDFIKNNAFIAHDIYKEKKPKLALGFAASYNSNVSSSVGSDNNTIPTLYNKSGAVEFANYTKIVGDMIFKYNGFALVAEYMNGSIDGNELYTNAGASIKLTTEMASGFYRIGSGLNIQTSYVFNNGWAVDGRYSSIIPEFDIATSLVDKQQWFTVGINKYIKNNAVKIGLNTTFIDEKLPLGNAKRMTTNLAIQILL